MNKRRQQKQNSTSTRAAYKRGSARAAFLNADEFKQNLLRYSSRHTKTGRQFALISIETANFETLLTYAGADEVTHMMNSVKTIAANTARDADRICTVSPGMMLMLLPETTLQGAEQATVRLREALTNNVRTVAQIKPVHTFRTAACGEQATDLQDILSAVGCCLDEHGDLKTAGETRSVYNLGTAASWFERYTLAGDWCMGKTKTILHDSVDAVDSWNNKQTKLFRISIADDGQKSNGADHTDLVQRARALQQLENQSIQRLTDFFLERGQRLYIAVEQPYEQTFPATDTLAEEQLIDASLDFVGILIQSQTLVPHLTVQFQEESTRFDPVHKRIQLVDYQLAYLFPAATSQPADDEIMTTLSRFLTSLVKTGDSNTAAALKQTAESIVQPKRPEHLNTIYKIRTHLRRLEEKLQANPIRQAVPDA